MNVVERPVTAPAAARPTARRCLEVKGLKVHFPVTRGLLRRVVGTVKAVDGAEVSVSEGETVALVGESGCGKSTLGRAILRVFKPTGGTVRYWPRNAPEPIDLAAAGEEQLRKVRVDVRMIFQDPFTSLNPRLQVVNIIGQPLRANRLAAGGELQDRVAEIMQKVGLRPEYMTRYPHAFSGGERQRIVIARALIVRPHLVVADEAVSALDVSVRAQTLNLLQDLQAELNLTYLFISHDLSVVRHISNHVAVMYAGRVVETAPTEDLFRKPLHPYAEALLSAIPVADPTQRGKGHRVRLEGEVADPSNHPPGCHFHPRCAYATDRCRAELPALRVMPSSGRKVACHRAEELNLRGVS